MFDYQTVKLMHRHSDDSWVPMIEQEHGPDAHDPERAWLRGARLFRCSTCAEEIVMTTTPGNLDNEPPRQSE